MVGMSQGSTLACVMQALYAVTPAKDSTMNIYIAIFLAFGACFGLSTFSNRHLFSEGPRHADTDTSPVMEPAHA